MTTTTRTISSKRLAAALAAIEADQQAITVKPKVFVTEDMEARIRRINAIGLYLIQNRERATLSEPGLSTAP